MGAYENKTAPKIFLIIRLYLEILKYRTKISINRPSLYILVLGPYFKDAEHLLSQVLNVLLVHFGHILVWQKKLLICLLVHFELRCALNFMISLNTAFCSGKVNVNLLIKNVSFLYIFSHEYTINLIDV